MLLDEHVEAVAMSLHEIGAVGVEKFTLHSGRSPIYIDLTLLASYPKLLRQAAAAYGFLLQPLNFDLLTAARLAGLPNAQAVLDRLAATRDVYLTNLCDETKD